MGILDFDLAFVSLAGSVKLLLNDGSAQFVQEPPLPVGDGPRSLAVGDLNGDDTLDLATANLSSDDVSLLFNQGGAQFTPSISLAPGGNIRHGVIGLAVGDLNGDDTLDLATANINSQELSVFLNEGNAQFAAPRNIPLGESPLVVVMGDLDGDLDQDLLAAGSKDESLTASTEQVHVLVNEGGAQFPEVVSLTAVTPADRFFSVTFGDLNRDALLDIVTANFNSGSVSVLLSSP